MDNITSPLSSHSADLYIWYSILTAHRERERETEGRREGEEENDCISEGIRRADMDGRGVTWSATSLLSY